MTEPAQCADDGLSLRVENLRLGHHVHHYPGHAWLLAALCLLPLIRRCQLYPHEPR